MKRLWRYIGYVSFFLFTGFVLCLLYALLVPLSLPKEQITIYDKDKNVLYQNTTTSDLKVEEITPFMEKALLTIEDKRFYSHIGFDVLRLGKSLYTNVMHKDIVEGGSTLTQQYAKNVFLGNEQTISRKIQEFFYALQLEMQYSKEDILVGYLNSIYYGHGVYGFKNAASFYFNKQVDELSISEVSLLIGIPNGPSYYSPYLSMENAIKKRDSILDALYAEKVISKEEYDSSIKEEIVLNTQDYEKESEKNYYIDAVLAQAKEIGYDKKKKVEMYTYYDPDAQKALSDAIRENVKGELQTSGVIIAPYTSAIIALQGGNEYTSSNYNRALYAKRQMASTIKPLLYYCALSQGLNPSSTFSSEPTTFTLDNGESYAPENFDKQYPRKDISMIHAISRSDNIYAVKTHLYLGMETLQHALSSFGLKEEANPSLALGTANASILDIATIYNTFASEGFYKKPTCISSIVEDKEITHTDENNAKPLLDRDTTLILNQMLTSTYDNKNIDVTYPTMYGKQPKVKTAVKSGTSDWDTLVVGYNPYYTIGIWNGYDDNKEVDRKYYDISKSIYQQCFNTLMEDKQEVWYEMSDNLYAKRVDPITGTIDAQGSLYWYLKE